MGKRYKNWFYVYENNYQNLEWYQQELDCARKALHSSDHQKKQIPIMDMDKKIYLMKKKVANY